MTRKALGVVSDMWQVLKMVAIVVYVLLPVFMYSLHNYLGSGGLVTKLCPTFETPWTVTCQAPLCIRFSRQDCWSGLPFPLPGDLPD